MADIDTDEHYKERGSFCVMDDPATGVELKMPGLPFRMLGKPSKIRFPGLPHGSANEAVYGELLNYSPEKVAELREQGAI
jgi:crotonobetainyl-CoA:carnitine CoA-transferase CaiB-like acyl-CoA transferase